MRLPPLALSFCYSHPQLACDTTNNMTELLSCLSIWQSLESHPPMSGWLHDLPPVFLLIDNQPRFTLWNISFHEILAYFPLSNKWRLPVPSILCYFWRENVTLSSPYWRVHSTVHRVPERMLGIHPWHTHSRKSPCTSLRIGPDTSFHGILQAVRGGSSASSQLLRILHPFLSVVPMLVRGKEPRLLCSQNLTGLLKPCKSQQTPSCSWSSKAPRMGHSNIFLSFSWEKKSVSPLTSQNFLTIWFLEKSETPFQKEQRESRRCVNSTAVKEGLRNNVTCANSQPVLLLCQNGGGVGSRLLH